jgi:dihydroorotase
MPFKYDLLLKNGIVLDPTQNINALNDVAFSKGKVAAISKSIPEIDSKSIVDITGNIVTPGLIDIHGHYFEHIVPFSAVADSVCLPNGVTTTMDAGSSGWTHFDGFKEFIIEQQQTRIMALVNLSALGMMASKRNIGETFGPTIGISGGPSTMLNPERVGELQDLRFAQVEEAIRCIKDNPNIVLGVKIRLDHDVSGEANVIPALERARTVADATDTFIMVHVARVPIPLSKVFEYLKPGDIVTHIFHSADNNILDEKGYIRSEVKEAKDKGIIFDIGADRKNFGINLSKSAIEQNILPSTLSSDITKIRPGAEIIYTLPEVMSLYMALGMSLEEVIECSTKTSAKAIRQEGNLGTLKVGAIGDASIIEIESGEFNYSDGEKYEITATNRIAPRLTIKDGHVWNKK